MKRIALFAGTALIAMLVVVMVLPPVAAAHGGLVRTHFPAEEPGPPFYARIEPHPPYFFVDGEWAGIVFYREPGCVPGGFNLLQFFDLAAFGCPLTVHGIDIWKGEPFVGAPYRVETTGNGAVPVWFVPTDAAYQAMGDGFLSIGELAGIAGRRVGYADQFEELLQPTPLPPEQGGGGNPVPKLILHASGALQNGGQFSLRIRAVEGHVRTRIQFE